MSLKYVMTMKAVTIMTTMAINGGLNSTGNLDGGGDEEVDGVFVADDEDDDDDWRNFGVEGDGALW